MAAQAPTAAAAPFELVDIPGKGKGLVATRNLKTGEQILVETPQIVLPAVECTEEAVAAAVAQLSPSDRVAFHSLALADIHEHLGPHHGRFMTNAFEYNMKGGLCLVGARFNHSCAPNVGRRWDPVTGEVRHVASVDIDKGSELEFCYEGLFDSKEQRQQALQRLFGFSCTCPACSLSGDEQLKSDERRVKLEATYHAIGQLGIASPIEAAELVKEAFVLLDEEGLTLGGCTFAQSAFQAAAAWNDYGSAQAWALKNLEWQVREAGVESSDYESVKQDVRNPRTSYWWGAFGDLQQDVPRP
ncbi:hypothetical protein JCM8208_006997 [Rhodotorula glutinis]